MKRKRFRVDRDKFIEGDYNPLLGESKSKEERRNPSTPRSVAQSETQGTYRIPYPSTPPPPLPPPCTPTPPPPPAPPPPLFDTAKTVKMPIFKG